MNGLRRAVESGQVPAAEELLNQGVTRYGSAVFITLGKDFESFATTSIICTAVVNRQPQVLQAILRYRPAFFESTTGALLFHWIASLDGDYPECIQALVEVGFGHHLWVDENGMSGLHYAGDKGQPGFLLEILDRCSWARHHINQMDRNNTCRMLDLCSDTRGALGGGR